MIDMERLQKLWLLLFSSDYDGEMTVARNKVVEALKSDGKDIHWLAKRIMGGGGGGGQVSDRYNEGFQAGARTAATTRRPDQGEIGAAFNRGQAAGRQAGYADGFRDASEAAAARMPRNVKPDWSQDPTVYVGGDPDTRTEMPFQRWAAWALTRRRERMSDWEVDFCTTVAHWQGELTEKQSVRMLGLIVKLMR